MIYATTQRQKRVIGHCKWKTRRKFHGKFRL